MIHLGRVADAISRQHRFAPTPAHRYRNQWPTSPIRSFGPTLVRPYLPGLLQERSARVHSLIALAIIRKEGFSPDITNLLNQREFQLVDFSRFEVLRADSSLAVPASKEAKYLGSRFTIRVVENSPADDRRTLYVLEPNPSEIHIFSGKVVGAVKAANMVLERLSSRA